MSLADTLFTMLTGNGTVQGLVNGRVFPDQIPQVEKLVEAYPCVVYSLIDDPSSLTHDGQQGPARARVQFDCWAAKKKDCETLASAVRNALVGQVNGIIQAVGKASERSVGPDGTTLMRRHILDLYIWHSEI